MKGGLIRKTKFKWIIYALITPIISLYIGVFGGVHHHQIWDRDKTFVPAAYNALPTKHFVI
jgi:hypothetical protein